ncbi:MAG: hypothetical protein ACREMF_08115, partial [Gemmatimonadales bacterium]
SGVVLSLFAFHVGRALADRIRGPLRTAAGEDMKALREELTGELHQLRSEIGELAERLDFAERLLAKERDAARLGRPGGG